MSSRLSRRFAKVWQSLKKHAGVKSSPWFKKADTAVPKKVDAYREALLAARSGAVEDLLKLGKVLRELDEAVVKFVDAKGLGQIADEDVKKTERNILVADVSRFQAEVQHELTTFESRLRYALSAADNDLQKLESIEARKKKELWKGFGVEL